MGHGVLLLRWTHDCGSGLLIVGVPGVRASLLLLLLLSVAIAGGLRVGGLPMLVLPGIAWIVDVVGFVRGDWVKEN